MKNATGPKTGWEIHSYAIFDLVQIKNSEDLVALILEFHDVKWKRPEWNHRR